MSTQAAQPPDLRPRGVGEILDAAFRLWLGHWKTLVLATACVVVPMQILATVVLYSAFPGQFVGGEDLFTPQTDPTALLDNLGVVIAGWLVAGLLTGIMVVLTVAACFKAAADAFLGSEPQWRASVRFALSRLGSLLWISFLYVLGLGLPFALVFLLAFTGNPALLAVGLLVVFLLALPLAIWLAVAWTLSYPALLVEDARGTRALRRSFRLVRGRWWPTFGVLLVGALLVGIIAGIVQALFLAPTFFTESVLAIAVLTMLSSIVGYAISTPLQAVLVAVVFFDLRVRKEGLDLELLADRLGSAGAVPVPAGAGPSGGGWAAPQVPPGEDGQQAPPGWAPPAPPPER
ncbi:MAG TPA: hypothetical protein VGV40_07425 [Solirubrobacteraceae bacterium]|nr:hypothetical protein [Solirubrobacteraceae bacterium]